MNLKKEATVALLKYLEDKQAELRRDVMRNKWVMADLVKKQGLLKRQLAALQPLVNSLKVGK